MSAIAYPDTENRETEADKRAGMASPKHKKLKTDGGLEGVPGPQGLPRAVPTLGDVAIEERFAPLRERLGRAAKTTPVNEFLMETPEAVENRNLLKADAGDVVLWNSFVTACRSRLADAAPKRGRVASEEEEAPGEHKPFFLPTSLAPNFISLARALSPSLPLFAKSKKGRRVRATVFLFCFLLALVPLCGKRPSAASTFQYRVEELLGGLSGFLTSSSSLRAATAEPLAAVPSAGRQGASGGCHGPAFHLGAEMAGGDGGCYCETL